MALFFDEDLGVAFASAIFFGLGLGDGFAVGLGEVLGTGVRLGLGAGVATGVGEGSVAGSWISLLAGVRAGAASFSSGWERGESTSGAGGVSIAGSICTGAFLDAASRPAPVIQTTLCEFGFRVS